METVPIMLLTAGQNEAGYIGRCMRSVFRQTVRPLRWLIIDDGSTDATADVVRRLATDAPFVELLSLPPRTTRSWGAQYRAISHGYDRVKNLPHDFVGAIDADIVLKSRDYLAAVLREFTENPKLGVTGGAVHENYGQGFRAREFNAEWHVSGGAQVFRRECFEQIGGYIPLEYGGTDSLANIMARMKGWEVKSLLDWPVYHLRPTGIAWGRWSGYVRAGMMDGSLCYGLLFELLKCVRRAPYRPFLLASLLRLYGYLKFRVLHPSSHIPPEARAYLRREQAARMRRLLTLGSRAGQPAEPAGPGSL